MKKTYLLSLFAFIFLCMPVRSETTQNSLDSIKGEVKKLEGQERLNTYKNLIYEGIDFDLQLALASEYIAEANHQRNIDEEGEARKLKMVLYTDNYDYDLFFKELPEHLEFWEKHKQWENLFEMWYHKVNMYIHTNQVQTAIGEAEEMYGYAKEVNYQYGIGLSYSALGCVYHVMGRLEDAEENLIEALKTFGNQTNKMIIKSYFFLFGVMIDLDKYEEAVPLLERWENKLIQMDEEKNDYGAWHLFYLESAYCYSGLKEFDKAKEYINKASSLPIADKEMSKGSLYMALCNLYYMQEDWENAYLTADTLYQARLRNGDITASIFMLENKADLAYKSGRHAESIELYKELMHKRDSIRSIEVAGQLDELRTVYEVDKLTAEKDKNRNYLILAVLICIVLVVALLIWVFYSRKITKKNRGLIRQIKEQDRLSEELEKERTEKLKLKKLLQSENESLVDNKDDELFLELQKIMNNNKLYTESNITRKDIADKLGTNEKYLQETVKKSLGITFHKYLTGLRLDHARELITKQSDALTLEAIAVDSGLGSRSTLHRLFREHYELTPEEFKKLAKEKN